MADPLRLTEALPGPEWADARAALVATGRYDLKDRDRSLVGIVRALGDGDHEVVALAAVSRDPGRTLDYIDTIQDYQDVAGKPLPQRVRLYHRIYQTEGLIANAIRKIAAVVGQGGRWIVRHARRGRSRRAQEVLQQVLDHVVYNLNAAPVEGVVTGMRGMQAMTHQLVRQALIEGSWVGRQVWNEVAIRDAGVWSIPTNVFSVSIQHLEPVKEVQGTGIEAFYWIPPTDLLNELLNPTNRDVRELLRKYIPREYLRPLRRDRKVLLDPALLMHVKHRPLDAEPFGQSFIEPCLPDLAFKRNVEALDFVTTQTLINRLTIIKVGSSEPDSIYADPTTAVQRTALMARMLADPAPNSLLVWNGDDVEMLDIGAYNQVLNLDGRHNIARTKLHDALGVPSAMLTGNTSGESGSRSSGWAATIGVSAEVLELANNIRTCYEQMGERIALENGYTPGEIDLVWQWDNSLIQDKNVEYANLRLDYQLGTISIRTFLEARGFDPDAEYMQRCQEQGIDPHEGRPWTEVFAPVAGLPGSPVAPGRPTDDQAGRPPEVRSERPDGTAPESAWQAAGASPE